MINVKSGSSLRFGDVSLAAKVEPEKLNMHNIADFGVSFPRRAEIISRKRMSQ